MSQGQWQITNSPAANAAAVASITASLTGGQAIRLRGLQAALSGTAAGASVVTVYDGTTAGTVIWSETMAAPANGSVSVTLGDADLRAYSGQLTVQVTAGGASTTATVNAQGDLIPAGYSAFLP